MRAAGGRTLTLFTSWAAMGAVAARRCASISASVCSPKHDLPKPALLLPSSAADEATTLLATAGFFQGVDVPGRTLTQVIIDRLPFRARTIRCCPARRELLGPAAFRQIDLPGGDDARSGGRRADP